MGLKLKGEASFSHEGEELKIAIDINAILAVEEETGIPLLAAHHGVLSLRYCASLLRHGLAKGCGKEFSREEAAEILVSAPNAHDAVIDALEGFLPSPATVAKDGAPNPQKAAGKKPATGKNS